MFSSGNGLLPAAHPCRVHVQKTDVHLRLDLYPFQDLMDRESASNVRLHNKDEMFTKITYEEKGVLHKPAGNAQT